jgi:hypothetical protein
VVDNYKHRLTSIDVILGAKTTVTSTLNVVGDFTAQNIYTKTEVDSINNLSNYYLKSESDALFSLNNSIPVTPTTEVIQLGNVGTYKSLQFSASSATGSYIDFTQPNKDYNGRIIYRNFDHTMKFYCNGALALTINENGLPDYYTYSQTVSTLENYAGRFVCGKVSLTGIKLSDHGLFTFTSSKTASGIYSVTYSDPMSSTDYQVFITPLSNDGPRIANISSSSTTRCIIYVQSKCCSIGFSIFVFHYKIIKTVILSHLG